MLLGSASAAPSRLVETMALADVAAASGSGGRQSAVVETLAYMAYSPRIHG